MQLEVWGARGSHPASGMAYSQFGHHTACLSIRSGEHLLVLDAGTGASTLASQLAINPPRRVDILLSHFHHDHVMGLPFLLMAMPPGVDLRIHAALDANLDLAETIAVILSPPYFPAGIRDVLARMEFRSHQAGRPFEAGGALVETHPLEHPGGSTAFRVRQGSRSFVYATDLEQPEVLEPSWVAFVREADLLIHDTMFTEDEWARRRGWGHATIEGAVDLADAAGIPRIVGFHHNPFHDDAMLTLRELDLRRRRPGSSLAREGETLTV